MSSLLPLFAGIYSHHEILLSILKALAMAAWAAFGLLLAWVSAGGSLPRMRLPRRVLPLLFGLLACAVFLRYSWRGWNLAASVCIGTAILVVREHAWRSRGLLLALFSVVVASVSLAWWLNYIPSPVTWWRLALFALLIWILHACLAPREASGRPSFRAAAAFLFAAAGALAAANQAPYERPGDPVLAMLHHQGAFIGTALHILSGLVPFYDVPLQYGLGPALSVVAACRFGGCWAGMQMLAAAATLLMALLILPMALATPRRRGPEWNLAVVAVLFAACFFWQGLPFDGIVPTATPATGGLRFLPVVLIAFLLFFGKLRLAAAALVPAVLWSPEAAFMCIAVFGIHETLRLGPVRAVRNVVTIALAGYAALFLLHRLIYGLWIRPDVMAEYVLHIPGRMLIDPLGCFLFLAAALALAAWLVSAPSPDPEIFRRDLIVSSLLFAVTAYYLGRSHPANIGNLMPFIVLVALRALGRTDLPVTSVPVRLTAAALAAMMATIVWSPWNSLPFSRDLTFRSARIAPQIAATDPDIAAIRAAIPNPDRLGIAALDDYGLRFPDDPLWTAMDPWSLWIDMPPERRAIYIARSALRLRRSGWLIVKDSMRDELLGEFRVAYRVSRQTHYEIGTRGYTVALLTPLAVPDLPQPVP